MHTMKHFFRISSLLISTALLGCGGGGGGGEEAQGDAESASYAVSTLNLDQVLTNPSGIVLDGQGSLYVADTGADVVQKISNIASTSSTVTRILGVSGRTGTDYSSCTNSNLYAPYGIAIDSSGHLYVAERDKTMVRYADCTPSANFSAEYGSTGVGLLNASGIALQGSDLYVADSGNHLIRLISSNGGASGTTSTLAGTSNGYVNGASNISAFSMPTGVAVSSSGSVFVADTNNCAIRKITSGLVSTFAGAGPNNAGTGPVSCGSSDGVGTDARFNFPTGIAIDSSNNLYVADTANNKIRRITPEGVVTTIAGSGAIGSADGQGDVATFDTPTGIATDSRGNIYVVDLGSSKIRRIR